MENVPKLTVPPRSSRTATTDSRASRHLAEHRLGVRAQRAARLGQREPAADAREERDAELGLQAADLLADRRLREVQRLGGGAERAALGGGQEVLELLQVHLKALPSDSRGK